ncbi:MAG: sulfur-carrier protein [Candidatus Binatota bacterium]|jgi:molybdopterin converting factor small subunit|nr:sulfur-carrier protein [Candidatus Binatota bacterium]
MTVRIRLHAILKKFLPAGSDDSLAILEVPDGATVADVIARLGIPHKHAGMLVSGDDYLQPETPLREGQELSIFPPLAGGAAA